MHAQSAQDGHKMASCSQEEAQRLEEQKEAKHVHCSCQTENAALCFRVGLETHGGTAAEVLGTRSDGWLLQGLDAP